MPTMNVMLSDVASSRPRPRSSFGVSFRDVPFIQFASWMVIYHPGKPRKHSKKASRGIRKLPEVALGWRGQMVHFAKPISIVLATAIVAFLSVPLARAGNIVLSPEAAQALDRIYVGDPDAAITGAHFIEEGQPDSPLGYLIEAEARWWKLYCAACDIKYGMVDAWERKQHLPDDEVYLTLAQKVGELAGAQLAKSDTAEMHVYAGAALALDARLYALRGESHRAAHASVAGRTEFLRALALDPNEPDATAGMGIYNYFVDSLSGPVKILRFFMGIPGGSKEEGTRQMKIGIERGVLLKVDTQFYLARNLRTFDHKYEAAASYAEPLAASYPRNPIFLLLAGNMNAELSHKEKAAGYFHSAIEASTSGSLNTDCAARVRQVANSMLDSLR
jgi:hypothetical protein